MCVTGTPYLIVVSLVETESKIVSYLALLTRQTVTISGTGLSGILSGDLIHITCTHTRVKYHSDNDIWYWQKAGVINTNKCHWQ